jgi:prolyl oligopeptidase
VRPDTNYPATLIMAADGDDRVVPAHSYKFAAELQAANASGRPIIMRVESRGGHSVVTTTDQAIAEAADRLAFLDTNLGSAPVIPPPVFLGPPTH